MKNLCFNKQLLFILITAFLCLQWSTTHIHLASEHEHNGAQHQHAVTAHQHQLSSHHADAIDVATDTLAHADGNKIVEINQVCTHFHGKLGEQFVIIQFTSWNIPAQYTSSSTLNKQYQVDTYQTFYQYTSIRLRAPPALS